MSRGWESKSVESQQSEQPDRLVAGQPAPSASPRMGNITAGADEKRRLQALELQRERILSERTSSPHRRTALADALSSIEEELVKLGWTVHL